MDNVENILNEDASILPFAHSMSDRSIRMKYYFIYFYIHIYVAEIYV